jgi:DNA-binding PadR family transcriptional regulator
VEVAMLGQGRRFSEPTLLVLVSLLGGPKHGYAIGEDIVSVAGRRLGPGTLYGAIGRLEESGLVIALGDDGRRRPYALTDAGRSIAQQEARRLATLGLAAAQRLRAEPSMS